MLRTVVKYYHDQLNHPKLTRLSKALRSQFFIWGLEQACLKNLYLKLECDICASNVSLPKRTHSSHIKSFEIFERIQIDLTQVAHGDPEEILSRRGYRWVLTVIDCFSKYVWAYPLKSKETNRICQLLHELFSIEGIPKMLQSDNGGEFVSQLIRNLMPKLGIKLINGSPYSPTTQGQIERFNRTLKQLLRKEIQVEISNNNSLAVEKWANELVPRVIDSYIHNIHRSLSRTPWELYKNRTSPHPIKTKPQIESVTSEEINVCCIYPNPELGTLNRSALFDVKEALRHHGDVRGKSI